MKNLTSESVYEKMLTAIDDIAETAVQFPWEKENYYAHWLAQSFFYVQWTTRQPALASARTKPLTEDHLHWRFIDEAKEERRHERLGLQNLKAIA